MKTYTIKVDSKGLSDILFLRRAQRLVITRMMKRLITSFKNAIMLRLTHLIIAIRKLTVKRVTQCARRYVITIQRRLAATRKQLTRLSANVGCVR